MNNSRLGVALLGCGFASRLHGRTLKKLPGVDRFFASRDASRASEYARRFGGAGSFGDYQAAIEDPRVDVVLLATPPASHAELAEAAFAAGKHVIVEKPPFLSVAEFDRVAGAAERAGRRMFVAENYFYKPLLRAIRSAVQEGAIGEVRIIDINALKQQRTGDWRDSQAVAGGGAFFEGGIHWVSFMANLGLTVTDARGFQPGPARGVDRTMVALFQYAEGAVGTLMYSWEIGSPMKGLRLSSIYGSEGAITFESNGLFLAVRGRKHRISIPDPRDLLGYTAMFEDFFRSIREDEPAAFDLDRARCDLQLVERIYETSGGTSAEPDPETAKAEASRTSTGTAGEPAGHDPSSPVTGNAF
ncbi:MAG: Gfo/Idh/MocA family oxidoreductase [Gemmatimonadota bacterium]|nr:Gfo/Idh/MocA family oxidoreductase [Gemmatimonadota bacterium]